MNDFNDFLEDESHYEDGNGQRSIGVSIGILIVALLAIGLVWLLLRGSVPGLSPDLAIATKYDDTFTFGGHARYNLLVANLGDAPSVSRLTVMSTLSQATIPETVYAPEPWSCTLQEHSVTCQASGVVSSGQSLPAIEITTQLPSHASDGSNDSLRICAAVKTLLDTDLGNNETCEIVMLQTAASIEPVAEVEEPIEAEESQEVDSTVSDTPEPDAEVSETADDVVTDDITADDDSGTSGSELAESDAVTETVSSEAEVTTDADGAVTEESELAESDAVTETVSPEQEITIDASDVVTDESELTESETVSETVSPEQEIAAEAGQQQNEVQVRIGNGNGDPLTVAANGNVFVPIHLLPVSPETILTVATLQVQFDPALLVPLACNENPDKVWGISVCNPEYDKALGILRVTVLSTEGISDQSRAVNIEFQAIGTAGATSPITTDVISMVDRTQQPVLYTIENSTVVIE